MDENTVRALTTFFFFSKIVFEQLEIPEFLKENAWAECVHHIQTIVKPEYIPLIQDAANRAKNMQSFKHNEEMKLKNNMTDNEKSVTEQLAKIFSK